MIKELLGPRNFLGALAIMQGNLGNLFDLSLPGFKATLLSGPECSHAALVEKRSSLIWRNEADPVTSLLRHGLLVEDGQAHADLRRLIMPSLHRQQVERYIDAMWHITEEIIECWQPGRTYDMLVEMRRIALLVLVKTLFGADFSPDIDRLFTPTIKMLKSISPGLWLLGAPRSRYSSAIQTMDDYFYGLIRDRRARKTASSDLLNTLLQAGLDDSLIRDQLLTLFIAGHDTSTALLAWSLYMLGLHQEIQLSLHQEATSLPADAPPSPEQVAGLTRLDQVIRETLRLYPPIHVSNRVAAENLEVCGYAVRAGGRVMLSIYATHHDQYIWPEPERFDPSRFAQNKQPAPYTFLAFGGGPRNCIGAYYALLEAKVILARLLQRFEFKLLQPRVHLHMGATLEPRPEVLMQVSLR